MKDKIIAAATTLFVQNGYYQTSMDDVAHKASIAKGSLYYHFKNKSQLFCETVVQGIEYFAKLIREVTEQDRDNPVIAQQLIALLVDMCFSNQKIADMVMTQPTVGIDEEVVVEIQSAKERFIELIDVTLAQGIEIGLLQPCNTKVTAYAIVSFVYSYCKCLRDSGETNTTQATQQITGLIMKGLLR
ncbi:MAG: TetR/AcrR family transcriptional regulator [Oscillospiraceae bacterium]